jgi:hypothetical protein
MKLPTPSIAPAGFALSRSTPRHHETPWHARKQECGYHLTQVSLGSNVENWHNADVRRCALFGRYREERGPDAVASSSQFMTLAV